MWQLKKWQHSTTQIFTKLKITKKKNIQIVTKLKDSNSDKTVTKLKNSNCDTNKKKIMTKIKKSNCDKTLKLKVWLDSKAKMWQNQIYDKTFKKKVIK